MQQLITFLQSLMTDPEYYVGVVLSFFAVVGFLLFLRGFIAGVGGVFTNTGHDEHQGEARVRNTWGTIILLFVFVLWEITRIFGILGLIIAFAIGFGISEIFGEKKKGGGGH